MFDPEAPPSLIAEIETTLASGAPSLWSGHSAKSTKRLATLRAVASAEDAHVLGMLNAFEAGATTKADVMHVTAMSAREYHAARSRLARLVEKLFPEPSSSHPMLKKGA